MAHHRAVALVLAALAIVGCLGDPAPGGSDAVEEPGDAGAGTAPPAPNGTPPVEPAVWRFVDATGDAGLRHAVGAAVPENARDMATLVGGVSAADVDGDGWVDLFVADAGANSLWRNRGACPPEGGEDPGDGPHPCRAFENVTHRAGVAGDRNSAMGLFFDYDGDGDLDLFVANIGEPSRLLRNDGDLTFTDVTGAAGVGASTWAYGAAAADVDGDGDLDLSVVNYGPWNERRPEYYGAAENGDRDLLYINQGNGTFTEEAVDRGINATRWSFSHAWADYDGDGDQDLYVNVDFGFDVLYRNDGTGHFADVAEAAGTVTHRNGMGAVWVDPDNDSDLDVFATNIHIPRHNGVAQFAGNDLFRNRGDGTFENVAAEVGVADGGWGWDSEWGDYDHDGDLDALQANGMWTLGHPDLYDDAEASVRTSRPSPAPYQITVSERLNATHWLVLTLADGKLRRTTSSMGGHQVDRFFLNQGGVFEENARGLGFRGWSDSRSIASLDYDRDGDLDLVRAAFGRPVELFRNLAVETAAAEGVARHWLQVELAGPAPNPDAVGAVVTVEAGNRTMTRHVAASGGFMSQSQRPLHFGLGAADQVDALAVRWPGGGETRLEAVAADRVLQLTAPEA